jgi:uncharacterized membrane protein YdfJ with MMPL/SSD domain
MVGALAIFATLPILDMTEMGIGPAATVLIDATIVRAVLLPAAMLLLGDRNWYLPRWLEWLPRLEHAESRTAAVAAPIRARCSRKDRSRTGLYLAHAAEWNSCSAVWTCES